MGIAVYNDISVVRGTYKKVNFDSSGNAQPQWYYGGGWQFFKDGVQLSTSQVGNVSKLVMRLICISNKLIINKK